MLTVGPNARTTLLARASSPIARPRSPMSAVSKVAPMAEALGKQAVGVFARPRMPTGPSLTVQDGIPSRSQPSTVQASRPCSSPHFSSSVSRATRSSMSATPGSIARR